MWYKVGSGRRRAALDDDCGDLGDGLGPEVAGGCPQASPASLTLRGKVKLIGTEIWSCGGGTQSGAIAVLIGQGKLPKPDLCFMTDTGREKSST